MRDRGSGKFLLRGRTRCFALVAMVTIAAGPAMALSASPAASDDDRPTAYTYHLSGSTDSCQLAKVNLDNGHVTSIGPSFDFASEGCPWDLAVRPDDDGEIEKIYAVVDPCEPNVRCDVQVPSKQSAPDAADAPVSGLAGTLNSFLVTINPETGVRTTIGALGFGSSLGVLTFDDDGHLWYYALSLDPACTNGQCLYRLDPSTGAPTLVANPAVAPLLFVGGDASCDHVFANGVDPTVARLFQVSTSTSALSPRPRDYGATVLMSALGRDASGQFWGLGYFPVPGPSAFADVVYKIDTESGKATQVVGNVDIDHPNDLLLGLEIVPLSCDPPEAPPASAPPVVAAEPTFTG